MWNMAFRAVVSGLALSLVAVLGFVAADRPRLASAQVPAQPTEVYVYDSSQGAFDNGFNVNCRGYVWSQMGFLGPNGEPAKVIGNDLKQGQADVGDVLGKDDHEQANSYRSGNGKKEAYDLGRGATLLQAYQRVAANGKLIICTHGEKGGGRIWLEGDFLPGFKVAGSNDSGTGVGGTPYALPKRNDVTATLYSCWAAKDPDGPQNAQRSVVDSLEGILGAGGVTGSDDLVKAKIDYSLAGGTPQAQGAARRVLEQEAYRLVYRTNAGEDPDVVAWLTNAYGFEDQRAGAQKVLDDTGIIGVTVKLTYPEPDPPVPATSGSECPHICTIGGCVLEFDDAVLNVPLGSLPDPVVFLLHHPRASALRPWPGVPESMVLDLGSTSSVSPLARLTLPFFTANSSPDIYRLDPDGWTRLTTDRTENPTSQTVSVTIDRFGIFAAFAPPPPQGGIVELVAEHSNASQTAGGTGPWVLLLFGFWGVTIAAASILLTRRMTKR